MYFGKLNQKNRLILQRHFLTSCPRRKASRPLVISEDKLDFRFRGNDNSDKIFDRIKIKFQMVTVKCRCSIKPRLKQNDNKRKNQKAF